MTTRTVIHVITVTRQGNNNRLDLLIWCVMWSSDNSDDVETMAMPRLTAPTWSLPWRHKWWQSPVIADSSLYKNYISSGHCTCDTPDRTPGEAGQMCLFLHIKASLAVVSVPLLCCNWFVSELRLLSNSMNPLNLHIYIWCNVDTTQVISNPTDSS